jgi:hypothetical protein
MLHTHYWVVTQKGVVIYGKTTKKEHFTKTLLAKIEGIFLKRSISLFLIGLCLFLMVIPLCHAIDEDQVVNLGDFPTKLADALGIDLFSAQLLSSLILMSIFLLPSMLIAGYFGGAGAVLFDIVFVGLGSATVCTALGWLPYWILILVAVIVALLFAGSIRNMISGKGGE